MRNSDLRESLFISYLTIYSFFHKKNKNKEKIVDTLSCIFFNPSDIKYLSKADVKSVSVCGQDSLSTSWFSPLFYLLSSLGSVSISDYDHSHTQLIMNCDQFFFPDYIAHRNVFRYQTANNNFVINVSLLPENVSIKMQNIKYNEEKLGIPRFKTLNDYDCLFGQHNLFITQFLILNSFMVHANSSLNIPLSDILFIYESFNKPMWDRTIDEVSRRGMCYSFRHDCYIPPPFSSNYKKLKKCQRISPHFLFQVSFNGVSYSSFFEDFITKNSWSLFSKLKSSYSTQKKITYKWKQLGKLLDFPLSSVYYLDLLTLTPHLQTNVLDFLKLDKFRFKDEENFQHLNNMLDLRQVWISEKRKEKKESRESKLENKKDLSLLPELQEFSICFDDASTERESVSLENSSDYDLTNSMTSERQEEKREKGEKKKENREEKKNTRKRR